MRSRRGQQSNPTTRRLAIMNLALRGIEADFGAEHAETDGEPFEEKMSRLVAELNGHFAESERLK